jgi:hypothetical protein
MLACINRSYQQSLNTSNRELTPIGRKVFEAAIALYSSALDKHYTRTGKQNPNSINLPSRRLSSNELIVLHANILSFVVPLYKKLLAETNYTFTAIMSWNCMYFALDVVFARRWITETLGPQL